MSRQALGSQFESREGKIAGERVVVFSEVFHPDTISTAFYMTKIAGGLAREFSVEVVTAQMAGGGVEDPAAVAGIRIHRCAAAGSTKKGLLARIATAGMFCLAAFWRGLFRVRKGDVVFTVTNPPLLPYVAAWVARCKSARLVLLVHDVYPEVLAATGMLRRGSSVYNLLGMLARWLLKRTDCVVVIGRDMEKLLHAKGCPATRLRTIPNWAETDLIPVVAKQDNRWLIQLGLTKSFVVLYAGNSGRTHDVEVILGAARLLKSERSLHFLIAGFGRRMTELQTAVRRESLGNISVEPFAFPRSEQVQTLSAGDIALITFVPGMAGVSVPSRMYNIMAAGRPIIAVADAESELACVVMEEAIGWVVPPGDACGLANAVLEARKNPEQVTQMGARAARVAREKYSLELALEGYRAAVRSVTAN